MGKSEYIQLTIRLPPGLYRYVEKLAEKWGTTIQDTILIIVWDWVVAGED